MKKELAKENKNFLVRLWKFFTPYEKIWYFSILSLSFLITFLFPSTVDDMIVNPVLIMWMYLADVILNATCELLIAKQSRWNFIVSFFVEIAEIATLILIGERFATMTVTVFFWIPIDIISFVSWSKHKDKKEEDLTVVRTLSGWQEVLVISGIIIWTVGVGYLLTIISPEGILDANGTLDTIVCYLDAMCSAVAISNGLFILFRFREQWISWYIVATLETVMNIMMGQWVLLVLKAGYFTNTTYGYIKWTKYIKTHKKESELKTNLKLNEGKEA